MRTLAEARLEIFAAICIIRTMDKAIVNTPLCRADGSEASRARAAAWLSEAALRPTRQRLALAELLVGDGCNRHVTAEGLHEAARAQGVAVSLATVYNTLRAFCDAGRVAEVTVDGVRSYFDTRTDEHPHYYWEDEGRLTDAPNDAIRLAAAPKLPEHARLSRVDVVIRLRRKPDR